MNVSKPLEMTAEIQLSIERLYSLSARYLNDGPLSEWPELFTENCSYRIVSRANFEAGLPLAIMRCDSRGMLKDRVYAVESTMMYEPRYTRHHITDVLIREIGDAGYRVTANFSVIESLPDDLPRILIAGHYRDRIVSADGLLMFAEKLCIYDSDLVPNTIVYPV